MQTQKNRHMQKTMRIPLLAAILILAGCGGSDHSPPAEKKAQLQKLKDQQQALQKEIDKQDTSAGKAEKAKLVTLDSVKAAGFAHFIDLQGKIESQNTSYIAPRNG